MRKIHPEYGVESKDLTGKEALKLLKDRIESGKYLTKEDVALAKEIQSKLNNE